MSQDVKESTGLDLSRLRDPFPTQDVEWRIGRAGKNDRGVWAMCLVYITNRAIQERLDEVCGPENWKNEFAAGPTGGVLCGISIRVGGEWVTKWDGAENTEMEAIKGGLSGAMKRAGVQWGIGRYLYHLEEGWANVHERGQFRGKTKEGVHFKWDPPELPPWALPGGPEGSDAPKVNRSTGEINDDSPPEPKANVTEPRCPSCKGPMWLNTGDEKAAVNGGKRPDLKCKDKECDTAVWLGSVRDDVKKKMEQALQADLLELPEITRANEVLESYRDHPDRLLNLSAWIDEKLHLSQAGAA